MVEKMSKLIIITGASSGLGLSLAEKYLSENHTVIGISRTNKIKNSGFYYLKCDLSIEMNISSLLKKFMTDKKLNKKYDEVILINNAAMVNPIDYFNKIKIDQLQKSYQLNLFSPMVITHFVLNLFLKKTKKIIICNISSGAAIRSIANWSMYCTMKSGLKMFTDCINMDYEGMKKIKAISFYPGVMDTKMQTTIRNQKINKFKNVEQFRALKSENKLLPPVLVANALFKLLSNYEEINKSEYNVKDLI